MKFNWINFKATAAVSLHYSSGSSTAAL